jgi:hypothetical protein
MQIKESVKQEIEQALGKQIPDPGERDFAAFYSYLELNHPKLAVKLSQAIVDDPVVELFPDQLAQARTREQARSWTQRFFYRQDEQTGAPVLSKGKVGMAVMIVAALVLSPFLLSGMSTGSTEPTKPVSAETVEVAPAKKPAVVAESLPIETPVDSSEVVAPTPPAPEEIPMTPVEPLEPPPPPPSYGESQSYAAPPSYPAAAAAPRVRPSAGGSLYRKAASGRSGSVLYRRTEAVAAIGGTRRPVGGLAQGTIPIVPDASNAEEAIGEVPTETIGDGNMMFDRRVANKTAEGRSTLAAGSGSFLPGATLPATLVVGVLLADGLTTAPVLARTEDGAVFIGLATMNPARRVSMTFSEVSAAGSNQRLQAQAVGLDGSLGIPTVFEDMAPDLFGDVLRGTAQGVSDYVAGLREATTTTIVPGIGVTQTSTPPALGTSIVGALSNMFTPPQQNTRALIRVARVPQNTEITIVILGGNTPGN